jgi:hypothetical protein
VLDYKIVYILLIIENTTRMPYLKIALLHYLEIGFAEVYPDRAKYVEYTGNISVATLKTAQFFLGNSHLVKDFMWKSAVRNFYQNR